MARFAYCESGRKDNPAILFLHGFLGCKEDWEFVIGELNSEYRCIAIDLPGHGETSFPEANRPFGLSECTAALIQFLNSKRIQNCHLIGYSMGGRLALFLALHFPERIKKVVIESGSPGLCSDVEQKVRLNHDNQLAQLLESSSLSTFLYDWYCQPLFSTIKNNRRLFEKMYRRRLRNDPHGLARSLREMGTGAQPSLWLKLSSGQCGLLLIVGSEDKKFRGIANEIIELYPISQLFVAHNCGHNIHFEAPKLFIASISSFLRG